MTAVLGRSLATGSRRSYQRHVAVLLDEIDRRRHRLYLLRANGALAPGLRDLKAELEAVRGQLAATVAGRGRAGGGGSGRRATAAGTGTIPSP